MSKTRARRPSSQNSVGDYEVGYGKPPKHTQFQKGHSAMGGRKKTSQSAIEDKKQFEQLIVQEMNRSVQIREGDKTYTTSLIAAGIKSLMQKVARGDEKAIRSVINLISERLPPMQIKGFELEVVPSPYDGLSSEEAEARALVDLEKWWDKKNAS